MAASEALYGVVGALGGALLGGAAAIFGPLLVHRRQVGVQRADEETRRKEAQIARILKIRSTGREWLNALERAVQDLEARRPVDVDRFDEIVIRLESETTEAGHALAYDGLWMQSVDTDPHGIEMGEEWSENASPDLTAPARSQLLGRLRVATREIRLNLLQRSREPEDGVRADVVTAMNEIRAARAHLNAAILEQIEEINGRPARQL